MGHYKDRVRGLRTGGLLEGGLVSLLTNMNWLGRVGELVALPALVSLAAG